MDILNQEQKTFIERLAFFCMANVRNDSNLISNSTNPLFKDAKQVYIELFGSTNTDDIIEVTFALFKQYIQSCSNTETTTNDSIKSAKTSINELKRAAMALEIRLDLCARHQSMVVKFMSLLIKRRECTDLLYTMLIDYDKNSVNSVIQHLKMIKDSISSATETGAVTATCQYVIILHDSFDYILDDYLLHETILLESHCYNDVNMLMQHLDSYQNILESLESKSFANYSAFNFRAKHDVQIESLFKILVAYTNFCLSRTRSYPDLERQALSINESLSTFEAITSKHQKEIINLNSITNAAIQTHMSLWRDTGQIQTREALAEKINCLSKWKLHLSGKQLKRALRMLLNAEKEYMDNLQFNDLKQYFDEVVTITIGMPINVQVDAGVKEACGALIHGYYFQLHQALVNRLNIIRPGWDQMSRDTTAFYYCHPAP